ncbi:MAG: ATP-dependent DNA helicase PcrA [Cyanobacteria bacterium SIG29]|nr:ATP-dependent DNA helicase PcrA [Cyanobacteria bacterium SIG29]
MSNILEGLNREQKEAVLHDRGTILVLAGAGCGKTKVLTTRIANLVNSGVSPYEILAVTFTNKAAKEMVERLSKMVGEEKAKKMWIGTFHSISGRILRTDIHEYTDENGKSYDNKFVIYDDTDSNSILKTALKNCNLDEKIYQPKLLKTIISNAKNKMQDAYTFATHARDYRTEKYAQIYMEYQKQLQANNALDFDDMLVLAVKLLEKSQVVREKYFRRFKHILVDEFQDTNLCQYKMIKSIYTNDKEEDEIPSDKSLCVVGDVDQSIYSWRGADYRIILNLQSTFKNTHLIKLEQNYRSAETILEAANAVIENNKQRIRKNLYSNLGRGSKLSLYHANDEADEALNLVREVKRLSLTKSLSDMAVLYRTNSQSRAIEEACMANNVPYKVVGGLKFYDRKEIKDIIAYLKLIYNPSDSQSLKRIINVPKRSIGPSKVDKLLEISNKSNLKFMEVLEELNQYDEFSSGVKTKLSAFYEMIIDFQNAFNKMDLPAFIGYVLDKTGYIQDIKENEDETTAEGRIDNLQEFISVAKEFTPQDNDVLGEFLSQVSLVSDIDSYVDETQALTLMTLHSAKGLEFDTVFLAGLEEGIFPHNRSLDNLAEMEEERRLMYVGITRAKKFLYLSHAKRRKMWGEYKYYNPSRFLSEIPEELLDFNESSQSINSQPNYTFKKAVDTIKTRNLSENSDGSIKAVTSFGKGFVAPQKRVQHNTSFVIKSKNHQQNAEERKKADDEKIKELLENNPMKKLLLERRRKEAELTSKLASTTSSFNQNFEIGDRVFHTKYGVGKISQIQDISGSTTYIVDFGTQGTKALDSAFAQLKKF